MELKDIDVLIVDDVRALRIQVRDMLYSHGFRKFTVLESGEEAKAHLVVSPCNLILCDWHMGALSGLDLLKWVRKINGLSDIPFLMITAEQTRDNVVQAIELGVDNYLIKPISPSQVRAKILVALMKRGVI